MKQRDEYPEWLLWAWERGPYLFVGAGVLISGAFVVVSVYLDNRLDSIENRLFHAPLRNYKPPKLDDYQAQIVSVDDLLVRQWVYVPAYSHIYYEGGSPYLLETTLSIRNVDLDQAVYLRSVDYFDTNGDLVTAYLDQLIELAPLQTVEFLVERRDSSGGSGANFLVEWLTETGVDKPLVETVMVGVSGAQGICFKTTGIEISPPTDGVRHELD